LLRGKMLGIVAFIIITFALFAGLENNSVKAESIMQVSESQLTLNSSGKRC